MQENVARCAVEAERLREDVNRKTEYVKGMEKEANEMQKLEISWLGTHLSDTAASTAEAYKASLWDQITISDTCLAMVEWVQNPQAETTLSNILPCVDESTTNRTPYQSKEVIRQLVNVVNMAIFSIANPNSPQGSVFYYNQSGPLMLPLCRPFDSQLLDRQCQEPWEVSFANASMVWQNYTCQVSSSGVCVTKGRVTPDIYSQLAGAVNVSYGPLVLKSPGL